MYFRFMHYDCTVLCCNNNIECHSSKGYRTMAGLVRAFVRGIVHNPDAILHPSTLSLSNSLSLSIGLSHFLLLVRVLSDGYIVHPWLYLEEYCVFIGHIIKHLHGAIHGFLNRKYTCACIVLSVYCTTVFV